MTAPKLTEAQRVHVRRTDDHRMTVCGLRDQTTISEAWGGWGPGGAGFGDVCQDCLRRTGQCCTYHRTGGKLPSCHTYDAGRAALRGAR